MDRTHVRVELQGVPLSVHCSSKLPLNPQGLATELGWNPQNGIEYLSVPGAVNMSGN